MPPADPGVVAPWLDGDVLGPSAGRSVGDCRARSERGRVAVSLDTTNF
jgi:hypothetical protein